MEDPRYHFAGLHKVLWKHFASYNILSVARERLLKTQIFEKKSIFRPTKSFRPIFSRIIEYEKPQGTILKGPQDTVTVFVQDHFFTTYGVDEIDFSKKAILPMRNTLADFFWHYRVRQTSVNILFGSTRYSSHHCARNRIISVTPNRLLKTQVFEKKRKFFQRKNYFG